jgi:hypothetical protein
VTSSQHVVSTSGIDRGPFFDAVNCCGMAVPSRGKIFGSSYTGQQSTGSGELSAGAALATTHGHSFDQDTLDAEQL